MSPTDAAAIFVLAAIAAFTQAISGFGFSLLLVPPLAMVLGPKHAVVTANGLSLMTNLPMSVYLRAEIQRSLCMRLVLGGALGMPLGLIVLLGVSAAALQVAIAVMVLASTLLIWRGFHLHVAGGATDFLAGVVSGVLNTSTSMSGPPIVLYLQGRRIAPGPFRATLAAFFCVSGLVALTLYLAGGELDRTTAAQVGVGAPGLALGLFFGNAVHSRLDPLRFRHIVIGVLVLSAVIALAAAAAN
ncbi:hypothetical protein AYO38_10045 [bacterium SCGC AG-212-C10]|nr:hypothetical protein AYO38_10045 [bacterium SCGC AG-212-C10]